MSATDTREKNKAKSTVDNRMVRRLEVLRNYMKEFPNAFMGAPVGPFGFRVISLEHIYDYLRKQLEREFKDMYKHWEFEYCFNPPKINQDFSFFHHFLL
jgi:hypothetical protein